MVITGDPARRHFMCTRRSAFVGAVRLRMMVEDTKHPWTGQSGPSIASAIFLKACKPTELPGAHPREQRDRYEKRLSKRKEMQIGCFIKDATVMVGFGSRGSHPLSENWVSEPGSSVECCTYFLIHLTRECFFAGHEDGETLARGRIVQILQYSAIRARQGSVCVWRTSRNDSKSVRLSII
jgi:hypothetical protein